MVTLTNHPAWEYHPIYLPHIRYAYGALLDLGIEPDNITYATIDQIRLAQDAYLDVAP